MKSNFKDGGYFYIRYDYSISSGAPAGTVTYVEDGVDRIPVEQRKVDPGTWGELANREVQGRQPVHRRISGP